MSDLLGHYHFARAGLRSWVYRYPLALGSVLRQYPEKSAREAENVLCKGLDTALESLSSSVSSLSWRASAGTTLSSSSTSRNGGARPSVVLALGPYGATTAPGSEYSGLYPPPYGLGDVKSSPPHTNAYPLSPSPTAGSESCPESESEEALEQFHHDRLMIYASSAERWNQVRWVGFETIPLLREIRAIRKAMYKMEKKLDQAHAQNRSKDGQGPERTMKDFWICGTFPEGRFPQIVLDDKGGKERHATMREVVEAMILPV